MMRHRAVFIFIGVLMLTSLACNAFAGGAKPALTLPPPPIITGEGAVNETTTPIPGIGTLAPTATLSGGTAVPDDGSPRATALTDLNVRSGPTIEYGRLSFLKQGESARIIGKDTAGWWKIECPPRAQEKGIVDNCWISHKPRYTISINTEDVPIVPAPPLP